MTNFLHDLHPVASRERDTVLRLGRDAPGAAERLRPLLRGLVDETPLPDADVRVFPCLGHARDARAQIQRLLDLRPVPPGTTVIEIGADHGWMSSLLLDRGCRVIASDITDHLLLAPHAESAALCRIYADMNRLPIADETVDVVWATAAAHHSWDLGRTFAEAARVLRPAGRLYFCCEPMPSAWRLPFGRSFGRVERAMGINETWVGRSRWLALCRRAGLVPDLIFPDLDTEAIASRLEKRRLPASLGPILRPFLRLLQVSIHLVASKP